MTNEALSKNDEAISQLLQESQTKQDTEGNEARTSNIEESNTTQDMDSKK